MFRNQDRVSKRKDRRRRVNWSRRISDPKENPAISQLQLRKVNSTQVKIKDQSGDLESEDETGTEQDLPLARNVCADKFDTNSRLCRLERTASRCFYCTN